MVYLSRVAEGSMMMYPIRRDTVFSFLSNWANTSSVLSPRVNAFLMDSSLVETNFQKEMICFMFRVSGFGFRVSGFGFTSLRFVSRLVPKDETRVKFRVSAFGFTSLRYVSRLVPKDETRVRFQVSGFKFQVYSRRRQ